MVSGELLVDDELSGADADVCPTMGIRAVLSQYGGLRRLCAAREFASGARQGDFGREFS